MIRQGKRKRRLSNSIVVIALQLGCYSYILIVFFILLEPVVPGKSFSQLLAHFITTTIFVSNFIGVVFARSLHYQFYCWYFHTLPYLLWSVSLPNVVRVYVLLGIEVAFNIYPATWWSSAVLQVEEYNA